MSMYILKTPVENATDPNFENKYVLYASVPSPMPDKCSLIPVDESNFYKINSMEKNVEVCQQAQEAGIDPVLFVDVMDNTVCIVLKFNGSSAIKTIDTQTVELDRGQFPNGVKDLLGMINL